MSLDFKKPAFSEMADFMRKQVRFSSLENTQPEAAKQLFEKTVSDAKTRFYNYAALAGEAEKIRAKLEPEAAPAAKAERKPREKTADPEAEARRAARRAERAKKRKEKNAAEE